MSSEYVPPTHRSEGFNCPHCGPFTQQTWGIIRVKLATGPGSAMTIEVPSYEVVQCFKCRDFSVWKNKVMVYPTSSPAPLPNRSLPEIVIKRYNEARSVLTLSPNAACALLRMAVEELVAHLLGPDRGATLFEDIGILVKRGLPSPIQRALDSVRVIGNNAVHPGQITLEDNPQIASTLFTIVNQMATYLISGPKETDAIFNMLSANQKDAIEKRDSIAPTKST